jgi:hypothetical protein
MPSMLLYLIILFTDGRTPWTGDRPVARPLSKHRTQTQNKRIHTPNIYPMSGIRTHDPSIRASEDSLRLRPRGYCDWRAHYYGRLMTDRSWHCVAAACRTMYSNFSTLTSLSACNFIRILKLTLRRLCISSYYLFNTKCFGLTVHHQMCKTVDENSCHCYSYTQHRGKKPARQKHTPDPQHMCTTKVTMAW